MGGRGGPGANQRPFGNLEQKHPVSLLGELSSKRKWGAPAYDLVGLHALFSVVFYPLLSAHNFSCWIFYTQKTLTWDNDFHPFSLPQIFESGPAHAKNFIFKVMWWIIHFQGWNFSRLKKVVLTAIINSDASPTGPTQRHRILESARCQQQEGGEIGCGKVLSPAAGSFANIIAFLFSMKKKIWEAEKITIIHSFDVRSILSRQDLYLDKCTQGRW